jgi:iron complex outermembrane recepter protein
LEVTEGLSFSGGYRRDKARYEFDPSDPETARHKESAYTTGINYAYKPASHVYVSYAKSYRYPLLDEIYFFSDTDSINTDLKTQTSDQYEAGVAHQFNTIVGVSLNVFHTRTSNEIFFDPLVGFFGQNANMEGKTIRQGAELGASFRYSNFYLYTNYTFTDAEFDGGPFDGNEVPNVPRHMASANIGYQFAFGTSLSLSGTYVGKRPFISDFDNVRDDQKSYTIINAGIRHPWRSALFYLNLNNIFDEKYSAFGGVSSTGELGYFPSPGFNVLGGVMLRFGGI